MNAMIRMAHCITAPRLVLLIAYGTQSRAGTSRNDIWDSIKQIPEEETRTIVADAMSRVEMTAIHLMIARSPILLLLYGLAKAFGKISQMRKMIGDTVVETLEQAIAYEAR